MTEDYRRLQETTGDLEIWRLQKITGDYRRLQEKNGDYLRLLEITGELLEIARDYRSIAKDCWRLLEITKDRRIPIIAGEIVEEITGELLEIAGDCWRLLRLLVKY